MRKRLVAGNWKMHGSLGANAALMADLQAALLELSRVEVLVVPPAVYLEQIATLLKKAGSAMRLGAQDVSAYAEGAFTGQVSAPMLKELGCSHTLVGHSERRALCGETDELVAEKALRALEAELTPIVCIGETLEQRDAGEALQVVDRQLRAVVEKVGATRITQVVVAYEPVWAIGTGQTATPEQAQEVHGHIRRQLGTTGDSVTLLYGGSVKASNASELFAQPDIDGALVGGASLVADEFAEICNKAERI